MKRFSFFLILSLIFTNLVSAKNWANNVGGGATLSVLSIGSNKENMGTDNVNQMGYGLTGTYIGIHDIGFTAKVDVSFGLSTTKDIALQQNSKIKLGAFENIAIGAGYSFLNNDRFLFGSTLMLGVEFGQYSVESENETYNSIVYDNLKSTFSLVTASVGADIFGVYRLSEHFGLFANLSTRYVFHGNVTIEGKYEQNSKKSENLTVTNESNLNGNFIVQPTIGVIWNL